jgi:hypothetical protein
MSEYEKMLAIVEASPDDPIVKDIIRLVRERNKANAEIVRLHGLVDKYAGGFKRGAEAMRESAAQRVTCHFPEVMKAEGSRCGMCTLCDSQLDHAIRDLPIPEEKS